MPQTHTQPVPIRIELPLPVRVATSIINAVGTMWPSATIATGGEHWRDGQLTVLLPPAAARPVTKRTLTGLRDEEDAGALTNVSDGHVTFAPPEQARDALAELAVAFLTGSGAINYVEQTVTLPEPYDGHDRLVFTVQWADGRTPHELREQAEAELAAIKAAATSRERTIDA